jgi:hypothetical protein
VLLGCSSDTCSRDRGVAHDGDGNTPGSSDTHGDLARSLYSKHQPNPWRPYPRAASQTEATRRPKAPLTKPCRLYLNLKPAEHPPVHQCSFSPNRDLTQPASRSWGRSVSLPSSTFESPSTRHTLRGYYQTLVTETQITIYVYM